MDDAEPQGAAPLWTGAVGSLVRAALRLGPQAPVRVLDVRVLSADEAWAALEAAGRYCVAGLHRDPTAPVDAGAPAPTDGPARPAGTGCRLLYLYGAAPPVPVPADPAPAGLTALRGSVDA